MWEKFNVDNALGKVDEASEVYDDMRSVEKWARARTSDISLAGEESHKAAAIMGSQVAVDALRAAGNTIAALRRERKADRSATAMAPAPAPAALTAAAMHNQAAVVGGPVAAAGQTPLVLAMSAFGELMQRVMLWMAPMRACVDGPGTGTGGGVRLGYAAGLDLAVKSLHGLSALAELRAVIQETLLGSEEGPAAAADTPVPDEAPASPFAFVKRAVLSKKERNVAKKADLLDKLDRGLESVLLQAVFYGAICALEVQQFSVAADLSRAFLKLQWEEAHSEARESGERGPGQAGGGSSGRQRGELEVNEGNIKRMWVVRGLAFAGMGNAFVSKRHLDAVAGSASGYTGAKGKARSGAGVGSVAGAAAAAAFVESRLREHVLALNARDDACARGSEGRSGSRRGNRYFGSDVWLLVTDVERRAGMLVRQCDGRGSSGGGGGGSGGDGEELSGAFVRLEKWFATGDVAVQAAAGATAGSGGKHATATLAATATATATRSDAQRSQAAYGGIRAALSADADADADADANYGTSSAAAAAADAGTGADTCVEDKLGGDGKGEGEGLAGRLLAAVIALVGTAPTSAWSLARSSFYEGQSLFQEMSYRSSELKYVVCVVACLVVVAGDVDNLCSSGKSRGTAGRQEALRLAAAACSNAAAARMHRCLFGRAEVDDPGTATSMGSESSVAEINTEMEVETEVEAGYGSWLIGMVGNVVGAVAGAVSGPAAGAVGGAAGVDSLVEDEEVAREEERVVVGSGCDLSCGFGSGHLDGPLVHRVLATLSSDRGSGAGRESTHVMLQSEVQAHVQGSVPVAVAVAAGMDMLAASARERAVLAVRLCERAQVSVSASTVPTPAAASGLLLLLYKRLSDVLVADGAYADAHLALEHCRALAAAPEPESESKQPMGSAAGTVASIKQPDSWAAVDVPEGSRMFAHVFATADTDVCGVRLPCLAVHTSNGTIVTPDSPLSAPVAQAALGLGAAERALAFKRTRFGFRSE